MGESGKDASLRDVRLFFYQQDMERIDRLLDEFLKRSGAKSVFLVDMDGHLVTRKGFVQTLNASTISALVAGSFAATREMARILGEDQFTLMFHQGQRDHIHLSLVGNRAILSVIFDDRTNLGLVRVYTSEATERLAKIFAEIEARPPSERSAPVLQGDFGASAGDRLDSLFGDKT